MGGTPAARSVGCCCGRWVVPERVLDEPFCSTAEVCPLLPLVLRDGGRRDEGEDIEAVCTLFASTAGDVWET